MRRRHPSRFELLALNEELRAKLLEAEETIEAIRTGNVDALVVEGDGCHQTFTLEGSDHAYRVLVESMKEGAVTVSADGIIFYCNSRFAEMMRKPIQEIVGGTIIQYILHSDREQFQTLFKLGLAVSARGELGIISGDDTVLPAYLSINSLGIYDVPAVCMVVTDLTEQKRSEEIIAAEKLARSILNQAAEAIIIADENGRIIRASHAAEELCGEDPSLRSFNEVFKLSNSMGHEVRFAPHIGDKPRISVQSDLLNHAMRGTIAHGVEVVLDRGDGDLRNVLLSAGPVLDAQQKILGCTVTLTDITDLKRVEAELKRAKEEAERAKEAADAASRAKTAFLANMSHELRSPLGAVIGFAELLAANELTEEQRVDYFDKIKRNGQVLSTLIDDILDLSKVEAGHLQLEEVTVSLRELLYDVISALKYRVMEKAIAINVTTDGKIPATIASDPVRLKQILMNVLGNAIKFTERGSIAIKSALIARTTGRDVLRIAVEDTGCGLTSEQAKNLFEPFKQADSSTTRRYGGTGLGLALSRGLARALGGDLLLERSTPGEGCCFVIHVEAKGSAGELTLNSLSDLEVPLDRTARLNANAIRLDGRRLLLVDDAPDNQILVSRFLRLAGAKVDIADNGATAVEAALAQRYDLILMDIQMPVLDGLEATALLREKGSSVPIVALTAHAMKEERNRCLMAGCNEHLSKPINRALLLETVRRLAHSESEVSFSGRRFPLEGKESAEA